MQEIGKTIGNAPDNIDPSLEVLYQDSHLVAIHKPAGLLVHRTDLDRHETRFAVQMLRDQLGRRVWPVHRLDRGTSGVLLFALNRETAATLSGQFEVGRVEKTYLAVVRGWPAEAGMIDHPLTRLLDQPADLAVAGPAQAALTQFRRLATVELPCRVDRYPTSRYALIELQPLTGRRHQLRRHLKHISHPIVGDATYGKGRHNRLFQERYGCHRLLLAAVALHFDHPEDGRRMRIDAPPSKDFAAVLAELGWNGLTNQPLAEEAMDNLDELGARLNAETGRLAWVELQRHFAHGVVIRVAVGLDLVDVAARFAMDDRAAVQDWLATGQVGRATDADALGWQARQANFWAVVVAPWVLVQEIASTH